MKYVILCPEVAGGFGAGTVLDTSVHPPNVSQLHYEVSGWLGDDILTTFPLFIVSASLKACIEQSDLTGFEFDKVKLTKSKEYKLSLSRRPRESPQNFYWLKVIGTPGLDDFGLNKLSRLVISEKSLELLKKFNISHALIEDFDLSAN